MSNDVKPATVEALRDALAANQLLGADLVCVTKERDDAIHDMHLAMDRCYAEGLEREQATKERDEARAALDVVEKMRQDTAQRLEMAAEMHRTAERERDEAREEQRALNLERLLEWQRAEPGTVLDAMGAAEAMLSTPLTSTPLADALRWVAAHTKHGPNGSGASGPCDNDCIKCHVEKVLGGDK